MFKKREKNTNILKRSNEDRYLDESTVKTQEEVQQPQPKKQKKSECELLNTASTRDYQHYRQDFINSEVNDMSAFKLNTAKHSDLQERRDNATKHLEIDTAYDQDALAHARQNIEITKGIVSGALDPTMYRGEHGYQNYFNQTEEDLRKKKFSGTLGPVRAPTFIRNTTRVDYNPERCKDYYETGRCNFGDSCVFIHDRGDYKSGWQLDQEYEQELKRKQMRMMGHEVDEDDENYEIHSQNEETGVPLCKICESQFRSPIVTICGHHFCERCALQHYSKNATCFVCLKPTNGIFNEVKDKKVIDSMQKVKTNEDNSQELSEDEQSQDKSEESGVLSKAELAIIAQYKERGQEVNKKKYQPQTGWYIP